jgi:pseudouridine-5'-phosphate glycosidase
MLKFSRSVAKALESNLPIVALESTIITHGMPFPQNLSTARKVEKVIRKEGSVPATIAILNGKISIGLEDDELEELAKVGNRAVKTSRRDLTRILSNPKLYGSTTVAATMVAAKMAGIKVFVTGGIGGVHRDSVWDVSADLEELGKTNVAVVCAGAKSILDVEATLEYLETKGVPVITYGESDEFPAFYTRKSGFKSMAAVDSPFECAKMINTSHNLGMDTVTECANDKGMIIACPIPEKDQVANSDDLEKVLNFA